MKKLIIYFIFLLIPHVALSQHTDLAKARIVTEDIHRFWNAWTEDPIRCR